MNKSLVGLIEQLSTTATRLPVTHQASFAFTKLWNQVVVTFIGQPPEPTKGGCQPSSEERIAHAVHIVTERLFLSCLMRMAGEIEPDDAISRHDLSDGQLRLVTQWLRMGRGCGLNFCSEMREQERCWQVVEWLNDHYLDIWVEVEKKVPQAALQAQWRGKVG